MGTSVLMSLSCAFTVCIEGLRIRTFLMASMRDVTRSLIGSGKCRTNHTLRTINFPRLTSL